MSKKALTSDQIKLARFAKALGHPIRVAVIQMLAKNRCCSHGFMSDVLPIANSTLSQHLMELKNAGLIYNVAETPVINYYLDKENWLLLQMMMDTLMLEVKAT